MAAKVIAAKQAGFPHIGEKNQQPITKVENRIRESSLALVEYQVGDYH